MNPKKNKDITLKDLLEIFKANIVLFFSSVVLALFVAFIYISAVPPTYTRKASILIKDEKEGKGISSSQKQSFDDLGLFQSNTNINNELTVLKTPAFMQEVVKRLGLNNSYKIKDNLFRWRDLYNNMPFRVVLDSLTDNSSASFEVLFTSPEEYIITDLIVDTEEYEGSIGGKLDRTVETPWGDLKLIKTPFFNENTSNKSYIFSRNKIKDIADGYLLKLNVILQKTDASVVDLLITDEIPQRADNILNTLISVYNENWIKDKNEITLNTNAFIEDRLRVIEQELGVVDGDISSFKSEHLIPDVTAAANIHLVQSNENRSQKLVLENQLSMAKYISDYLKDATKTNELIPASTGIQSSTIESEISKYNELLLQRDVLLANSGQRNPLVVDMNEKLIAIKDGIIRSVDELVNTLSIQISSAKRVEQQNKAKLADNPNQAKELINIERQQTVKEALYLYLLQKREENELSQAFTAYNTKIISLADGSNLPTEPRKSMILLFALVLGLAIPIVYLFLKESLDTMVKSKKDIEGLNIPLVGSIPSIDTGEKKGFFGVKNKSDDIPKIAESKLCRNMSNEAFRVVRTNLDFILGKKDVCQVIQIVSLNPSSGKSFISANLSNCMSKKKGTRVLVIDGDMRRYALSKYIDTPKRGLSNYLSGSIESFTDIIVKDQISETLDIIPVGIIPPNPSELLLTDRFESLLNQAKNSYDYIFIDCPPVEVVPDAAIVGKYCDASIFIIRAGNFDKRFLSEVTVVKDSGKYNNMCLLLNDVSKSSKGYGYGYGYGYDYTDKED